MFLTAEPSFQSSMHEAQDSIPRNPTPSRKHLSPSSEGWDIQELSFASVGLWQRRLPYNMAEGVPWRDGSHRQAWGSFPFCRKPLIPSRGLSSPWLLPLSVSVSFTMTNVWDKTSLSITGRSHSSRHGGMWRWEPAAERRVLASQKAKEGKKLGPHHGGPWRPTSQAIL